VKFFHIVFFIKSFRIRFGNLVLNVVKEVLKGLNECKEKLSFQNKKKKEGKKKLTKKKNI